MEAAAQNAAPPLTTGRPEALPDILLDGDRLNMLLDIICNDYITASYASRENGKRVIFKALQKLSLSVYASAAPHLSVNVQDVAFMEICRAFFDELLVDFDRKRQEKHAEQAAMASHMATAPITDDSIVKETLKPKLVQFVEDMVKERDRQLRALDASSRSSTSSSSAPRSLPLPTTSSASLLAGTAGPIPASNLPASTWQSGEIRMEGWLRKKGQHVNLWRDRYFMIRSTPNGTHYLCYFRKKGEKEPRDWYILGPGTTVDEVRESPSKIETKPLFTFRIRHMTHGNADEPDENVSQSSLQLVDNSPMVSSSQLLVQTSRATGLPYDMPLSPDGAGSGNDYDYDQRSALRKTSSRKFRGRAAAAAAAATAATAIVLTGGLAGVGIGMGMGMSAAAAASAGAAGAMIVQNRNKGPIALAAESLETAIWWRNSIVECIAQAEEQWKRYLNWYMDKEHELGGSAIGDVESGGLGDVIASAAATASAAAAARSKPPSSFTLGKPPLSASTSTGSVGGGASRSASLKPPPRQRAGSFGNLPRSIAKTFRTSATFSQETSWRLYDYSSKLRVDVEKSQLKRSSLVAKASGPPPALRTSLKVHASPKKVFDLLMQSSSSFYRLNHVIQEVQLLEENTGDHSDVVYWKLAPTYLWPVYVEERDLCLLRYWRKEQDASYFICFQSTTHAKCPTASQSKAVRGAVLGGGFIISPRVHADDDVEECWVTLTIQMNPKGWIDSSLARSWYYMHAYGVYFLEMVTALSILSPNADAIPRPYLVDSSTCSSEQLSNTDASTATSSSQVIVSEVQYPMVDVFRTDLSLKHVLPPKFWSEPDASSFLVRGPQYFTTHAKVRSTPQAFRLIGVELLKSSTPDKIRGIGLSSLEAQGVAAVDGSPLVLVINFMIPGPPSHSLVLYFTPEHPAELKKNSVFADLCHDFFRGPSDEYRTKRLKLIPRVVQGTWSIREGVGSTPVILGTKVNHTYVQGAQFVEVDYDIGSSTVASGVLKMMLGYARDLVIDLAFVIEAQSALELPERVLGCVRLNGVDLRHAVAYAKAPVAGASAKQSRV